MLYRSSRDTSRTSYSESPPSRREIISRIACLVTVFCNHASYTCVHEALLRQCQLTLVQLNLRHSIPIAREIIWEEDAASVNNTRVTQTSWHGFQRGFIDRSKWLRARNRYSIDISQSGRVIRTGIRNMITLCVVEQQDWFYFREWTIYYRVT